MNDLCFWILLFCVGKELAKKQKELDDEKAQQKATGKRDLKKIKAMKAEIKELEKKGNWHMLIG